MPGQNFVTSPPFFAGRATCNECRPKKRKLSSQRTVGLNSLKTRCTELESKVAQLEVENKRYRDLCEFLQKEVGDHKRHAGVPSRGGGPAATEQISSQESSERLEWIHTIFDDSTCTLDATVDSVQGREKLLKNDDSSGSVEFHTNTEQTCLAPGESHSKRLLSFLDSLGSDNCTPAQQAYNPYATAGEGIDSQSQLGLGSGATCPESDYEPLDEIDEARRVLSWIMRRACLEGDAEESEACTDYICSPCILLGFSGFRSEAYEVAISLSMHDLHQRSSLNTFLVIPPLGCISSLDCAAPYGWVRSHPWHRFDLYLPESRTLSHLRRQGLVLTVVHCDLLSAFVCLCKPSLFSGSCEGILFFSVPDLSCSILSFTLFLRFYRSNWGVLASP